MENNEKIKCLYQKQKCNFDFTDNFNELPHSEKTKVLLALFENEWIKPLKIALVGLSIIFLGAIISIYKPEIIFLNIFGALQVWVSFILGIVATLFSVISMYLSFYNLEQQKEVENKTRILTEDLNNKLINTVTEVLSSQLKTHQAELKKVIGQNIKGFVGEEENGTLFNLYSDKEVKNEDKNKKENK